MPWQVLTSRGFRVCFATPDGQPGQADPRMLTGADLGLLNGVLRVAEVSAALARRADFVAGPPALRRDSPARLDLGFTVRDGHYLSARWPGDAHRFANEFATLLAGA